MSKHIWTGEELQQHLDEWDERMRKGESLDWTLSVKATIDPFKQEDCVLTCGETFIALSMMQAIVVQDWFRSHAQIRHAVPSNPRDTQFVGFAKLLWQDIAKLTYEAAKATDFDETTLYVRRIEQIIARRTYDLIQEGMEYLSDYMPDISDIPDMTAWPKDGEE